MRKIALFCMIILLSIGIVTHISYARFEAKITGPWLWMIAPTELGKGGAESIAVDSLAAASGGTVTEEMIAQNGANEGDVVGDKAWTLGEISAAGTDNVNQLVNSIGLAEGEIDDHSSYALITIESASDQNEVMMDVGSDDAIKVWLNGEVVHELDVNRPAWGFWEGFPVNLKAGDNRLLVKVSEGGRGWAMFAGIQAEFDAAGKHYEPPPPPGDKIAGPWLWLTAPTPECFGTNEVITATDTDWLAEASNGAVTEEMIAQDGAREGTTLGDVTWTSGRLASTGANNVNDLITQIRLGEGDVESTAVYAFTYVLSETLQDTWMFFGSDDSIKVWLNGENVWTYREVRPRSGDFDESVRVTLQPGVNSLLVKVYECRRRWSMFTGFAADVVFDTATLIGPDGSPLTPWDVNADGTVNLFDLVLVASAFGQSGTNLISDVNSNGTVDVFDLVIIGSHFGEGVRAAPDAIARRSTPLRPMLDVRRIQQALAELEAIPEPSQGARLARDFLRTWLASTKPAVTETKLHPNYPNPFNPETWIPYQLAETADVSIDIYDTLGQHIRTLDLGVQSPGRYMESSRAAYWDGRNAMGETVASGVYFYRLRAGEYTEIRPMVILK